MNWIAITKASLYDTKAAVLIDTADTVLLGTGQTSRVTGVIADVTAEIRRKCARVGVLDTDTTKIPGGLKSLAVDLIVARLKRALEQPLSQDERDELARHERTLDRIAEGKESVDTPDDPVTAPVNQAGAGAELASSSERKATRTRMEGLL